jgi:hypothetical protein
MGLWTEISGSVRIRKDKHFSLNNHIENIFDEIGNPDINQTNLGDYWVYSFGFNDSIDGDDAVKKIKEFIDGIPGTVDIETNIRWVK